MHPLRLNRCRSILFVDGVRTLCHRANFLALPNLSRHNQKIHAKADRVMGKMPERGERTAANNSAKAVLHPNNTVNLSERPHPSLFGNSHLKADLDRFAAHEDLWRVGRCGGADSAHIKSVHGEGQRFSPEGPCHHYSR
jgi:hypothetical protein